MSKRAVTRWYLLPIVALLSGGTAAAQGNRTTISGQVIDSAAQVPLAGAEVLIIANGSAAPLRGARTNAAGRYTLTEVPAGEVTVRARFVGYAPKERVIQVRNGDPITADFALTQRSLQLDQVVITGTGGVVQRRAVGNVIETIQAAEVLEVAAPRSVEQLIGARTPGVIVLPAPGQVGAGAQLRVRSVGSLSLSNDPIIYIDGVRMDANTSTSNRGPGQRGGAGASRLNDVNPEDIESIEIIKGPAAATLYGTEASNGVVQIITKRGRAGRARWDFSTRQGANWLANAAGRAGLLYACVNAQGQPAPSCLPSAGANQGQLVSFNLYRHEIEAGRGPIFTTGKNQGYIAALSGGTDANRYYLSGAYDDDVGIVPWNWEKKFTGRANIDAQAGTKLRFQGSLGHIRDRIRLAQGAIEIDPFSQLVWGRVVTRNDRQRGFANSPPEMWRTVETRADNDRTTISLTGMYTPFEWFTHRVVTGLDVNSENNWALWPRQPVNADLLSANGQGMKRVDRSTRSFLTLDYSSSAKYDWRQSVQFTTSVGLQAYRAELSTITATANTFPAPPVTTVTGGTTRSSLEEYEANATVGMFVQQQAAWNNRVFLTAALRGDDNSAFGKDYSAAYYPKFSASWVVSEEPWWSVPFVRDLRLRGALGAAGAQPGTFDAARTYEPSVGYTNIAGLIPQAFGNPALRPERSQELELGFETSLFGGRADLSFTRYFRNITDAIVEVPVPPSLGFPGNQVVNIGRVKGWGNELGANVRILQGGRVGWEIGTQIASNGNRIEDLGGQEFLTVGGGGQAQNRVGFGIADFFLYNVRSAVLDPATGDVVSAVCDGGRGKGGVEPGGPDVPCLVNGQPNPAAARVYWGHSQPTWQTGFNTTVTLYDRLRLYARVDGNGGHLQSNTEIRALHNQGSTRAVIMRDDPFLQVYRIIEADAPGTYKAGFLKLRELSATYTLAPTFLSRVGASSATIGLAGRNLAMLWTAQHGWNTSRDGEIRVPVADQHVWDPEIRANGRLSNGYQTILPPTSSITATLRLTF
jgi:TonB-linked SusC/RagA family outer membrane protein